jgi:molybdopterin-guanine dinucleotide biosynthesis protein A
MERAAIVLTGGASRRMGQPKAWLPFGDRTLLEQILDVVRPVVRARFVVAAAGQHLPALADDVQVVHDLLPGRGPLEGLRAGLRAAQDLAELFFVSSCDVPLLKTSVVERLFELVQPSDDIVVPRDAAHFHPLTAIYHRRVLSQVEQLLAENRLRPFFLFERVHTRAINVEMLRDVDPTLQSLRNLNTPEEYQQVMAEIRQARTVAQSDGQQGTHSDGCK